MSLEAEVAPTIDTTPAPTPEAAPSEPVVDKAQQAEADLDEDLRKTYRRAQRDDADGRDEAGRFKDKDGQKLPDTKLPTDARPDAKVAAEAKPAEIKPTTAVQPPNAWKAEDKAKFATLPPDLQRTIADREAQAHREISELGQHRRAVETLQEVFQPHAARLGGASIPQYTAQLLQADAALTRDPVGFIKTIADHYKIDMNTLVSDPYAIADPQSAQLQHSLSAANARIEQLERMVGEVGQRVNGREQAEQQSRLSEVERMITEFSTDKPDFGSLKSEIEFAVAAIRQANPELSPKEALQEAYDRARWANPATRKAILEQQQKDADAKRLEDARAASDRARRASGINVRSSQQPVNGATSLDDDLRATWRRIHAN